MRPSHDRQRGLVIGTLANAVRGAFARPQELRYHAVRDVWATTKAFGARGVANLEVFELADVADMVVEGYVDDRNRAVLAALCRSLGCRTFFEIGTNRGRTAWTVARNNPECQVFTLDLPDQQALGEVELSLNQSDRDFFARDWDRGEAYADTPEEERITTLKGDSATFDFSEWAGRMDLVFVDGAHSYEYVENDTRRALEMLSPTGTIVWDDYPAVPGVYRFVNELAPTLDRPLYHVLETRLVIYSRRDVVTTPATGTRRRLFAA
jgi:predicted O-methyltransferase YrrM